MDTLLREKRVTVKEALELTTGSPFQFTRLDGRKKRRCQTLADLMSFDQPADERWLMVSPHDDDVTLGAGLLIQAAVHEGIDVHAMIVTDGRMGYCSLDQRDAIIDIRRRETNQALQVLGIQKKNTTYLGFPDSGLAPYRGRRASHNGDPTVGGYTGLQNAFTHVLRKVQPTRVFVPTIADLHPDHQITNAELMISLFHAAGSIWPELGEPLAAVPKVYELAIYCDFPEPPQIEIKSDDATFDKKLASIAAYQSQAQITSLIESLRASGPYEYVRELNFRLYRAEHYKSAFA